MSAETPGQREPWEDFEIVTKRKSQLGWGHGMIRKVLARQTWRSNSGCSALTYKLGVVARAYVPSAGWWWGQVNPRLATFGKSERLSQKKKKKLRATEVDNELYMHVCLHMNTHKHTNTQTHTHTLHTLMKSPFPLSHLDNSSTYPMPVLSCMRLRPKECKV